MLRLRGQQQLLGLRLQGNGSYLPGTRQKAAPLAPSVVPAARAKRSAVSKAAGSGVASAHFAPQTGRPSVR